MENDDAKKRSDVALHSVENAKIVNNLYEQVPEDNVALSVNQFRRFLNNKGMEIKKVGEPFENSKYQSHGKFTFEMTYDELCIKYDNLLFYETCTTKVEKIELSKKVIELQKENNGKDYVIAALEAQVQKLLKSQENLMNQIHVLKANNVMYHKANRKQLLKLNEANDKVIRLTIGAEKISLGKPHGDKSGLGYVENESSSTGTKSNFSIQAQSLDLFPHVINVVNWATFILSVGNFTLGRMTR
ncbi:hypothetical protein D8674_026740 [Pyrus ussuriensis x Pyrus communis]|uniref:Uncharacterized protein n=1 Tax=Pyrus ussuriensis x Pyrus communis TaxID=2448454 RepID=A0A5N5I7R0_9ROSA|nr:hypothetical protein D8674_026740 [Pyrus ussuriensis x Pyrus communis]